MNEYIKKADMEKILYSTNNVVRIGELFTELPTYSFPDSSDDKGEWIKLKNGYKCSKCGHIMDKVLSVSGNLIYQYSNYCPECGKKMT